MRSSADCRTIRSSHTQKKNRAFVGSKFMQRTQLLADCRVRCIGPYEFAQPLWLLATFDLQDLRPSRGEQFLGRFDPGDPTRSSSLVAFHFDPQETSKQNPKPYASFFTKLG